MVLVRRNDGHTVFVCIGASMPAASVAFFGEVEKQSARLAAIVHGSHALPTSLVWESLSWYPADGSDFLYLGGKLTPVAALRCCFVFWGARKKKI